MIIRIEWSMLSLKSLRNPSFVELMILHTVNNAGMKKLVILQEYFFLKCNQSKWCCYQSEKEWLS